MGLKMNVIIFANARVLKHFSNESLQCFKQQSFVIFSVNVLILARNICVHCKCTRNSHDIVQVDQVLDVRERLGWDPPKDPSLQPTKDKAAKLGYAWIPAGLSKPKVGYSQRQAD